MLAHVFRVIVLVARVSAADGANYGSGAGGVHVGMVLGALVGSQQSYG